MISQTTPPEEEKTLDTVLDEIKSLRQRISEMEKRRDKQFEVRLETSSFMVERISKKIRHFSLLVCFTLGLLGAFGVFAVPYYFKKNFPGLVEKATIIEGSVQEEKRLEDTGQTEIIKNMPPIKAVFLDKSEEGLLRIVLPDQLELEFLKSWIWQSSEYGKRQVLYFRQIGNYQSK